MPNRIFFQKSCQSALIGQVGVKADFQLAESFTMTCFKPLKAWKQTKADLEIPAKDYYALKKISFRPVQGRQEIEIPCGHCLGCRLDHANMWATRMTMESKSWKKNCFITLTYNTPNLPINKNGLATLIKKDVQDFMKRLRYHHKGNEKWTHPIKGKEEYPIRFFGCGEYGPKGGRPHYHLAIFNWEPDDLVLYKLNKHGQPIFKSKSLQNIWGKGFVTVEEFNYQTAAYISRYVQKKAGIEPQKREYTGEIRQELAIDERNGNIWQKFIRTIKPKKQLKEPEFILMSRGVGIGRMYWEENKDKIKKNTGILIKIKDHVVQKPIPKYFKKLWEQENWVEYYRYKYEQEKDGKKRKIEIINRVKLPDGTSNELKWEFYLETQHKILKDKAKYLKRNEFI